MAQRHGDYTFCEFRRQYEALKDVEYQAAIAQWKIDAAAAQACGDDIPKKPKRRQADASYDRRANCIPVTFYIGAGTWTSATCIDDVIIPDEEYGDLGISFRYHLIDPHSIPDDVFPLFSTDVGLLLKVLKYQSNKSMLNQFKHDPAFENVDGAVARFIDTATNMGLSSVIDMEGVTVNMCMGLQLLVDDGVNRGINIGMQNVYAIMDEIIAGTSDSVICEKLGVSMDQVDAAKMRISKLRSAPVSP